MAAVWPLRLPVGLLRRGTGTTRPSRLLAIAHSITRTTSRACSGATGHRPVPAHGGGHRPVEHLVAARHAREPPGRHQPGQLRGQRAVPVRRLRAPARIARPAPGQHRGDLPVHPVLDERPAVAVHLEPRPGRPGQRADVQQHAQRVVAEHEVGVVDGAPAGALRQQVGPDRLRGAEQLQRLVDQVRRRGRRARRRRAGPRRSTERGPRGGTGRSGRCRS